MFGICFMEYSILVAPIHGHLARPAGDNLEDVVAGLIAKGARLLSMGNGTARLRYGKHPRPA